MRNKVFPVKIIIFILCLLSAPPGVFPYFSSRAALASGECHMPPCAESQMGRYSAFVSKKQAARRAGASSYVRLPGAPARAFSESRPYEGLRPAVGERKLLALLVDFDDRPYYDVKPEMRAAGYFEDLLFNEGRGSLNRYFKQASGGKLSFAGRVLKISPAPGADAFWYRSVRPYRDWGRDVEAFETIDSSDISSLAAEVIANASRYVDFSVYDADRDGILSPYELHIVIFHSGGGQEFTAVSDDIWSHRSTLDTPVRAGGVMIENYILVAHDSPVGVLCHETAHDLGLFDIYDTYSGASVLGAWSLMDRGAWNGVYPKRPGSTPALPSAYERIALGWIKPVVVGSAREELYLKCPSSATNVEKLNGFRVADAVKIEAPGSGGAEYLLFENRYKTRDTFDDDIPPALKRENGILVYHVDERMPDRAAYQYANDSRNSFYRVSLARPPAAGADLAYYTGEFSRYSSRLQKFHNGALNSVRMNCTGDNSEFAGVAFNNPFAHIGAYEVAFADGAFDVRAWFSCHNKGLSKLSAHLSARDEGGRDGAQGYYSETALFENEPVAANYFQKKVPAGALKLLDSGNYFVRFRLMDGDYYEERTFGPFAVANCAHKHIRIFPAAINKGEVSVNVYLSPAAAASAGTEEVFYSYADPAGYRIEKQAAGFGRSSGVWDYRTYRFTIGDEAASDISVRMISKDPFPAEVTGEVRVVRSVPRITHGVYAAPVLDGVVTIMAESDRKLFQAQLLIAENGAGTVSVGMYSRYGEGPPFVYYYNYTARSSGVVSYFLECADAAGNSVRSEGETFIHRFPLSRGTNYFAFDGGTIELSLTSAPAEIAGREAFLSVRRSGGAVEIKLMPEEYNAYGSSGMAQPSDFKMFLKAAGAGRRFELVSSAGVKQKPVAGGYFELAGFGLYRAFETAGTAGPAPAAGAAHTIAAPNPARGSFRVVPRAGGFDSSAPPRLKIYDAAMTLIDSFGEYSGGAIDASGYAPGVYFYSLEGAGVKSTGRITVIR